jgi:hypothetical protein
VRVEEEGPREPHFADNCSQNRGQTGCAATAGFHEESAQAEAPCPLGAEGPYNDGIGPVSCYGAEGECRRYDGTGGLARGNWQ